MGWLVWIALTSLAGAAAYALAAWIAADRGTLFRWMSAIAFFHASLLICLYATGAVGLLSPAPLGALALTVHAAMLWIATRRVGSDRLLASLEADLRAPIRLAV